MKKFKNITLKIFIVACMFLVGFATATVRADTTSEESSIITSETQSSTGDLKPEDYEPKSGDVDSEVVEKYTSRIFNFLYVIAVIVTIVVIMYVGLKYIVGSVSEKAEYKKNLVPIAVGALLITFLATIIRIIISIASTI